MNTSQQNVTENEVVKALWYDVDTDEISERVMNRTIAEALKLKYTRFED